MESDDDWSRKKMQNESNVGKFLVLHQAKQCSISVKRHKKYLPTSQWNYGWRGKDAGKTTI